MEPKAFRVPSTTTALSVLRICLSYTSVVDVRTGRSRQALVAHELRDQIECTNPWSVSRWCTTSSRAAWCAPRSSSSARKMTDSGVAVRVEESDRAIGGRQRALDHRDHRRDPAAAGERDDGCGVRRRDVNTPAGGWSASPSPSATSSSNQLETRPPATRFTVRRTRVDVAAASTSSSSARARRRPAGSGTCRTGPLRTRTRHWNSAGTANTNDLVSWVSCTPATPGADGTRGPRSCGAPHWARGRLVDDAAFHHEAHVLERAAHVLGRVAGTAITSARRLPGRAGRASPRPAPARRSSPSTPTIASTGRMPRCTSAHSSFQFCPCGIAGRRCRWRSSPQRR